MFSFKTLHVLINNQNELLEARPYFDCVSPDEIAGSSFFEPASNLPEVTASIVL